MYSKPSTLKSHSLQSLIDRILFSLGSVAQERKVQFFFDHDLAERLEVLVDGQELESELFGLTEKVLLKSSECVICVQIQILEIFEGKARFYFEIKNPSETGLLEALTMDLEFTTGAGDRIEKRYPRIFLEKPVLIIADELLNQLKIRKILGRHQIKSQVASDAKALPEILSKDHFAALILSRTSSSFEKLVEDVKTESPSQIPVIYIPGVADPEYLAQKLRQEVQTLLNTQMIQKLGGYKLEGQSLLKVLAADYFQATPSLMLQLTESLKSGNFERTQYFAHRLKSSSLILGLVGIGSYCEKLELLNDLDSGLQILSEIDRIFEKSRLLLFNYLDNCAPKS